MTNSRHLMNYSKKMVLSQSYERNLQVLAPEMHKTSNGLSALLMKYIFPINRYPINLKQNSQFSRPRLNAV